MLDLDDISHNCCPWSNGVSWPWHKVISPRSRSQCTHTQNPCPRHNSSLQCGIWIVFHTLSMTQWCVMSMSQGLLLWGIFCPIRTCLVFKWWSCSLVGQWSLPPKIMKTLKYVKKKKPTKPSLVWAKSYSQSSLSNVFVRVITGLTVGWHGLTQTARLAWQIRTPVCFSVVMIRKTVMWHIEM